MPQFILEKLNLQPTLIDKNVDKIGGVTDNVIVNVPNETLINEPTHDVETENDTTGTKAVDDSNIKEEKEVTATCDDKNNTINNKNCITTKVQKITPSDRSKALAQSRILLDETLNSLKELCQSDIRTKLIQIFCSGVERF